MSGRPVLRGITMSAMAISVMQPITMTPAGTRSVSLAALWCASVLAFFYPGLGRVWTRATLMQACVVAGLNTLLALGWVFAVGVFGAIWNNPVTLVSRFGPSPRTNPAAYGEAIRIART